MEIQEQKQLADWLLKKLSFHGDVALAGGAPRDWVIGEEAMDLDIFFGNVGHAEVAELIAKVEEAIDYKLEPITPKRYEDSPFTGYECEIEGQAVQFLFHKLSVNEVVEEFPLNCSRVSYRDGVFTKGKTFFYFEDYRILIEGNSTEKLAPDPYFEKMVDRFGRRCTVVAGIKSALRKIGGVSPYPAHAVGFLDDF